MRILKRKKLEQRAKEGVNVGISVFIVVPTAPSAINDALNGMIIIFYLSLHPFLFPSGLTV